MRRALRLAARGFTHPNPMVGCVIVRNGEVVGEGFHAFAGGPHAEVNALASAGARARGATAYVSMEPCSHHGRTPPCANALVQAGVTHVVAAVEDPNPVVSGRGFGILRAAGISVDTGLMQDESRRLNSAFFHFHKTGLPHVTLKAAITLDGKIATRTGDSKWITGNAARRFVHRLRARSGAVLVGIGTALADDPTLTARIRDVPRQPLRIVLDSRLRIPVDSRLVSTASESPVMVACTVGADPERRRHLESNGVHILELPPDGDGRVSVVGLMDSLGRRGITSVLVEGGGEVHAAFLEKRLADRLLWFIAPRIAGGRNAPTSVEGCGIDRLADAIQLSRPSIRRMGEDILIDASPQAALQSGRL